MNQSTKDKLTSVLGNDYPIFAVDIAFIVTKLQNIHQNDLAKELDNALVDFFEWYERKNNI